MTVSLRYFAELGTNYVAAVDVRPIQSATKLQHCASVIAELLYNFAQGWRVTHARSIAVLPAISFVQIHRFSLTVTPLCARW